MKNNLTELSLMESIKISGGDCSDCNDNFWSRLGKRFGDWLNREAERVWTLDPDDPRFKYR